MCGAMGKAEDLSMERLDSTSAYMNAIAKLHKTTNVTPIGWIRHAYQAIMFFDMKLSVRSITSLREAD